MPQNTKRLGTITAQLTKGKVTPSTPISKIMQRFPRDTAGRPPSGLSASRKFREITMDTPLDELNRFFFDYDAFAIVTERNEDGSLTPVRVVTKVDLLMYLTSLE